jgi:hypothetical protein
MPPLVVVASWTRAKTRIIGAAVGNIIAAIMVTQRARNNGPDNPMVGPPMVKSAILACANSTHHAAAARPRSNKRMSQRSRESGWTWSIAPSPS